MKQQVFTVSESQLLSIVDGLFHKYASDYRWDAETDVKMLLKTLTPAKPTAEEFVEWLKKEKKIDVVIYFKLFNERSK